MDRNLLNKIKQETLEIPLTQKEKSDEFAGVYLISNRVFDNETDLGAIHSFYVHSRNNYPLYFFISNDAITKDFENVYEKYPNIQVKIIPTLKSIYEFNDFSINQLLYYVDEKHENLLYFQEDGHLIKEGFENFKNFDWIGAAWKEPIRVIENKFNFPWQQVGNGGFNFRKRSKCLEVLEFVNRYGGQQNIVKGLEIYEKHKTNTPFLAEDAFFCHFGFGGGFFQPTPLDQANKFSLEPITFKQYKNKESIGYHRIDNYE